MISKLSLKLFIKNSNLPLYFHFLEEVVVVVCFCAVGGSATRKTSVVLQVLQQSTTTLLHPSHSILYKMASLLGAGYDSSDDETRNAPATSASQIVAAPEVNTEVWSLQFASIKAQHT